MCICSGIPYWHLPSRCLDRMYCNACVPYSEVSSWTAVSCLTVSSRVANVHLLLASPTGICLPEPWVVCRAALVADAQRGTSGTQNTAPRAAVPGLLDHLATQLLTDAQSSALAPLLLAVSAALELQPPPAASNQQGQQQRAGEPSTRQQKVEALAAAAEDAGPWGCLGALLRHDGLHEGPERRAVGAAAFRALGATFAAFGLPLAALPAELEAELMLLLDDVLHHDAALARCVMLHVHADDCSEAGRQSACTAS
jgi:hypothetical protein